MSEARELLERLAREAEVSDPSPYDLHHLAAEARAFLAQPEEAREAAAAAALLAAKDAVESCTHVLHVRHCAGCISARAALASREET